MAASSAHSKIDCHCHFIPPEYRTALEQNGYEHLDGMPAIPPWSVEDHEALMNSTNIKKSILSLSSPGTHLIPGEDKLARRLTEYCNDFASTLKKTKPDRFGFFASLPLPDVEGSLSEIDRVVKLLDADGFALLTNHHGIYLGDPKFDSVFNDLNRREAVVFIHPTTPATIGDDGRPISAAPLPDLPKPIFEFFFETARVIINLFLTGTVARCPNITFVIAHMSGSFPPLLRRFATIPSMLKMETDQHVTPKWVQERLNSQFYFDSAGWPFPEQVRGLLEHVTVNRMVYGSDYCFTPASVVKSLRDEHERHLPEVFPEEEDQRKLYSLNAERMLGRKET